MSIVAGSRLGPYEIVSPIGAGGMGEVFRARDTRLERNVAIKILPPALAHDPQFRARFEREAKTISQLNHPHICQIYDVGEAPHPASGHPLPAGEEGQRATSYLVMELLEGESLADRLARGALPLADVLRYGAQIAEALATAHRAGIVHRDLKPGNVMITKSGAKLLDFGLAKSAHSALSTQPSSPATALETEHKPLTAQGTILGTFQYMAPEQLEGIEADPRTDIFALGAVLYEMVTGRRAFDGKTKTSLIAAIVKEQPTPVSQIQPLTPPAFEHVVAKCLEKDPDDRWQSTHDIAQELKWISGAGSQAGVAAPLLARKKSRERAAWLLAAVLGLGLAAAALYISRNRGESPTYSFTIPTNTTAYIWGNDAAISPDGRTFAFTARKDTSSPRFVWIRPVGSFEAQPLEGTEGAGGEYWSMDSRWILFNAEGKLKRVSVEGGAREIVADRATVGGSAMNATGTVLYAPSEGGLYRVEKGGAPRQITTPSTSRHELAHGAPHFLPDGKRFLFLAFARDAKKGLRQHYLYAGELDSKEVKFLGEITSEVAYVDPGYLFFVREGSLLAAPFDARKLEFTGEPLTVADGVFYFKPAAVAGFSASRNGILTFTNPTSPASLVWLDRSGKQLGEPLRTNESFGQIRLSRDGLRVAVAIANPKIGTTDLWTLGLTRQTASRLTFDEGWEDYPVLTPDGSQMFYSADHLGIPDIFVKRLGSTEADRPLVVDAGEQFPNDVSPDGKYLIYHSDRYDGNAEDIWSTSTDGKQKPRRLVGTPFREEEARISPDGNWVAYVSSESGKNQVYVKPFPGDGEARQISTVAGILPRWSPDSRLLYFTEWNKVMVAELAIPDGEPRFLFKPEKEIGQLEVAPDGNRFLVELTDTLAVQQPTRVIVNWPAMIQNRKK